MPTKINFACLFLALSACSKVPKNGAVTYVSPHHEFSCDMSGDWKVSERPDGKTLAAFWGPPQGPDPLSVAIYVDRYPYPTIQDYFQKETMAKTIPLNLAKKQLGPHSFYVLSSSDKFPKIHSTKMERVTTQRYFLPDKGGLYDLVYVCSKNSCAQNESVFLNCVQSFKTH